SASASRSCAISVQHAYQIHASRYEHVVWDARRISAASSVFVTYAGPARAQMTRYGWRVRVWDGKGRASAWSVNASWETGLLQPSDWSAAWIGTAPSPSDSLGGGGPSPLLRRAFRLNGAVASARLYATSLGLYA